MQRPCKYRYCSNELPEGSRPDKEWCSDTCGREGRRMLADPEYLPARALGVFYAGLSRIRRLTPGTLVKGGTNRRVSPEAVSV